MVQGMGLGMVQGTVQGTVQAAVGRVVGVVVVEGGWSASDGRQRGAVSSVGDDATVLVAAIAETGEVFPPVVGVTSDP